MDQRPRACWNVLSVFAPVAGFAGALLAGLIRNAHPMSGLKVGVMTLGDRELTAVMAAHDFCRLGRWRSWFADPTGEVVYRNESP